MRKRAISCFLLLIMTVAFVFPVLAEAVQQSRIIQSVQIEDTTLTLLCAYAGETEEYEVSLEGERLPVTEESVDSARMPVTLLCLVDTSGSISNFKMKLLRDTLMEISSSMGADDSMILVTVDNQLSIGEPLQTVEERTEAINGIKSSHKDTNLNYGIVKSLEQLSSDARYNFCKCLVVLSDGVDFQDNGSTEQEVLAAVENARLPVFTVALVENHNEREGAKVLGSFARSSYGGMHLSTVDEGGDKPIRRDASGTEFGAQIWDSLMATAVLSVDISDWRVLPEKTAQRLSVQYKSGNNVYEDYVDMPTSMFPVVEAETEATTAPTEPTITETTAPNEEDEEIIGLFQWGILGAAAAVILVVAWVLVRKKAGEKKSSPEQPVYPVPTNQAEAETEKDQPQQKETIPRQRLYNVFMTDIPYGRQKLRYQLLENCPVTLGRDSRAAFILNPGDSSLSGKHFSLVAQNGRYCVRDEGSTNGTFLNGVPISGKDWCKLQSGDKIRAGGYEYRIVIEAEVFDQK